MRAGLAVVFVLAAVSASAQNVMDRSDANLDRSLVLAAFRSITEGFNDPYSVQLDRLEVSRAADGTRSLCGFVNKLDFRGQYGGFKPFAYTEKDNDSSVLITGEITPAMLELYRRLFRRAGCEHLLPMSKPNTQSRAPAPKPAVGGGPPPAAIKNLRAALLAGGVDEPAVYDRAAARYVTASTSPAVLDYVVCLEGEVAKRPNEPIQQKVDAAKAMCAPMVAKFPAGESAEDIYYQVLECGFRPGDASPDMGC